MMPPSRAAAYTGKAQSLPAKRLMAIPSIASKGVRLTSAQNELVGMNRAPMANPRDGSNHTLMRASAAAAYQASANPASSTASGKDFPDQF